MNKPYSPLDNDEILAEKGVSEADFGDICRICMQLTDLRMNLFVVRKPEKITELLNLEISADDHLPQNICCSCCDKLENFCDFVELAQSSDQHLRNILNTHSNLADEITEACQQFNDEEFIASIRKRKTLHIKKEISLWHDKTLLKDCVKKEPRETTDQEDVVMIIVPDYKDESSSLKLESDHSVEIGLVEEIDDLASSEKLTFDEHSYTKPTGQDVTEVFLGDNVVEFTNDCVDEMPENDGKDEDMSVIPNSNSESKFDFVNGYALADDPEHNIFRVMMESTICEECDTECSSLRSLTRHYLEVHNTVLVLADILLLTCPLCKSTWRVSEKQLFIEHLCAYKSTGYHFVKVNKYGKVIKPSRTEADAFTPFRDIAMILNQPYDMELSEDEDRCSEVDSHSSSDSEMPFVDKSNFDFLTEDPQFKKIRRYGIKANGEERKKGSTLLNHLRTTFYCDICGKGCGGRANLNRHVATHSKPGSDTAVNQKLLECSICRKIFNSKVNLKEHLVQHNDELLGAVTPAKPLNFMCSICGEKFPSKMKLLMHKVAHRSHKKSPYRKCDICERMFLKKSTFERHVAAHSNPNFYTCHVCKLPLPSTKRLKHHLRTRHAAEGAVTYDCEICNISFLSEVNLADHKAQSGHDVVTIECKDCEENFETAQDYASHIKLHTKFKECICGLCGKELHNAYYLTRHVEKHLQVCEFLCSECGSKFSDQSEFFNHKLVHQNENKKTFKCSEEGCTETFSTKSALNSHKKYHDGACTFTCEFCSESFFEGSHLTAHLKIHIGRFLFFCPHCQMYYITKAACKNHIMTEHDGADLEGIIVKETKLIHEEEMSQ